MRPLFVAMVYSVVLTHFAFLAYLPVGGLLALRWRRSIAVHALAVLWGIGSAVGHFWCPLTALERWARARAALAPLSPAGFIDHYLTGVLYPIWAVGYVQAAAFPTVLVSWILYVGRRRRGPSRAGRSTGRIAAAH